MKSNCSSAGWWKVTSGADWKLRFAYVTYTKRYARVFAHTYRQAGLKAQNQNFFKNLKRTLVCWVLLYVHTRPYLQTHTRLSCSLKICLCHTASRPQAGQSTLSWLSCERDIHRVILDPDRAWIHPSSHQHPCPLLITPALHVSSPV